MFLNRLLDSVFLLALMVGFYPAIFFIANNWFFIGLFQSICLLGVLSITAFLAISTVYLIVSSIKLPRMKGKHLAIAESIHLPKDLQAGLIVILSVYILIRFLDVTMLDLQKTYPFINIRYTIFLTASFTVVLLLLVGRKLKTFRLNLIRVFNIYLLVVSMMALFSLPISIVSNYDKVFGSSLETGPIELEIYDSVRFESTPNIYLIVPDSYPSNPLLDKFFNFDNRKFTNELQRNGFTIYDDYYASYPYSVESMHSMLAMKHNFFMRSIGNDSANLRKVIGGTENHVINILNNNGYRSFFLHESDYLVKEHCMIHTCLPQWSELEVLKQNLKQFYFFNLPAAMSDYNVGLAMKNQIAATEENSRTFSYKHFMDAHSTVKAYRKAVERQLPEFRKTFPAKIEKVNEILLEETAQILQKDQSAIIIIVSDHGTWAGAVRSELGLTENETLDKLNVFLAIKWGAAYDGSFDNKIKTSVNLFRYIFAYLSRDKEILKTVKDDDGYFKQNEVVWKVLENGAILEESRRY